MMSLLMYTAISDNESTEFHECLQLLSMLWQFYYTFG